MKSRFFGLILIPVLFFAVVFTGCQQRGSEAAALSVSNLIDSIDSYKAVLLKTSSVAEFVEMEKRANDAFGVFKSSKEALDKADVDRLINSILNYNKQTYLQRLDLEGRVQLKEDAESLNESLEEMEISMKIEAEESKTLGEFLMAISRV